MTGCCDECGATFQARGNWQRLCWTCWRNGQQTDAYDRGYADGYRDGARMPTMAPPPTIGVPLLRDLIGLAHPDRHPPERSEAANRATAMLLDLLDRERQAA